MANSVLISGVLTDAVGKPILDRTIELRSTKTSIGVLKGVITIMPSSNGSYSQYVSYGHYSVYLCKKGEIPIRIGEISISSLTAPTSINELLLHVNVEESDLTPDVVSKFQEESRKSQEAANKAVSAQSNASVSENNAKKSEANAKTSANNAKASETNAKKSETNSKASETNSKASETNAKVSETNAKESETNAKISAEKAKLVEDNITAINATANGVSDEIKTIADKITTSANNAKASETNANNILTNIKKIETGIKTSETNVKKSETNTKASETNAKKSETNAKTSETNTKASETASKTSETNAQKSATNAKRSEDNASRSATNAKDSEKKAQEYASSIVLQSTELDAAVSNAKTAANNAKKSETAALSHKTSAKSYDDSAALSATNSQASSIAAQGSADNAKVSEDNAKASELASELASTNSKASETKSASSATSAKASETNAKKSETNAKTSETNAKTSETNAKKSENSTKSYLDKAQVAETNSVNALEEIKTLTGKAIDAVNQAGSMSDDIEKNWKQSQALAQTTATNAANAKTSETNAKKSETNSKTSETNAKNSETNAKKSENSAKTLVDSVNAGLFVKKAGDTMAGQLIVPDSANGIKWTSATSQIVLRTGGDYYGFMLYDEDQKRWFPIFRFSFSAKIWNFENISDLKIFNKSVIKEGDLGLKSQTGIPCNDLNVHLPCAFYGTNSYKFEGLPSNIGTSASCLLVHPTENPNWKIEQLSVAFSKVPRVFYRVDASTGKQQWYEAVTSYNVSEFSLSFKGDLGEKSINDLTGTSAGIYGQGRNTFAKPENGYPIAEAGDLTVTPNGADGSTGCSQMYVTYRNGRQFIRNYRGSTKTWEPWVEVITTGNISKIIPIGDQRNMPFRANELPFGWYFRNGDNYLLDSPQGQALNRLSNNYKADHKITIKTINNKKYINVPTAFTSDGRGYFERPVNGSNRQVGSIEQDAIRNITGTLPNGSGKALLGHENIANNERHGAVGIQYAGDDTLGMGEPSRKTKWVFFDFDASRVVPTANENRPINIGVTPVIYLGV